jgi:uncharacterized protein YdhG (YjbR/CyaY superfamily)
MNEVEDYLAKVPDKARPALELLRKQIKAAAPGAEEVMSYGVVAFKQGRMLVSFGAAKSHCAFYVMSPAVMEAYAYELKSYDTSKGTIRFPFDQPLPAELVEMIVATRLEENEAAEQAASAKKK